MAPRVKLDSSPQTNRPMPIGWHPIDAMPFAGGVLERLREAMGH